MNEEQEASRVVAERDRLATDVTTMERELYRQRLSYAEVQERSERTRQDLMDERARRMAEEAKSEQMRDALRAVNELARDITAALLAVKGHLTEPYADDPRWSPWTRFVEPASRKAWDIGEKARAALPPVEDQQ